MDKPHLAGEAGKKTFHGLRGEGDFGDKDENSLTGIKSDPRQRAGRSRSCRSRLHLLAGSELVGILQELMLDLLPHGLLVTGEHGGVGEDWLQFFKRVAPDLGLAESDQTKFRQVVKVGGGRPTFGIDPRYVHGDGLLLEELKRSPAPLFSGCARPAKGNGRIISPVSRSVEQGGAGDLGANRGRRQYGAALHQAALTSPGRLSRQFTRGSAASTWRPRSAPRFSSRPRRRCCTVDPLAGFHTQSAVGIYPSAG